MYRYGNGSQNNIYGETNFTAPAGNKSALQVGGNAIGNAGVSNSTTNLLLTGTTETYATPAFSVPVNGSLAVGNTWRIKLYLDQNTQTAQTLTVHIKYGISGTTSDADLLVFGLLAGNNTGTSQMVLTCTASLSVLDPVVGNLATYIEALNAAPSYSSGTYGITSVPVQVAVAGGSPNVNTTVPAFLGVSLRSTVGSVINVVGSTFEIVGETG